jgi:hypothetical protein
MKRIILFVLTGLIASIGFVQAVSADVSARRSQEWTAEQRFVKGTIHGYRHLAHTKIDDDGNVLGYDASGVLRLKIEPDGTFSYPNKYDIQPLEYTAGTGFEFPSTGSFFTFDITAIATSNITTADLLAAGTSGITIVLPTPTADIHGRVYPILKTDSGTTLAPLYSGGLPIDSASGTTNAEMDALGDILYLMPSFESAVSWYVIKRYIH